MNPGIDHVVLCLSDVWDVGPIHKVFIHVSRAAWESMAWDVKGKTPGGAQQIIQYIVDEGLLKFLRGYDNALRIPVEESIQ